MGSILPVNKVNLGISSVIPDVDEGVGYKGKNGDGVKCTTYADLRQHVGSSRSRPSRGRLGGDSVPKEGRRQERRVPAIVFDNSSLNRDFSDQVDYPTM